jgi:hypothetical protein
MRFNIYSVEPLKNQKQALNFIKDWLNDDENIVVYAEKKVGQHTHLYQHYE